MTDTPTPADHAAAAASSAQQASDAAAEAKQAAASLGAAASTAVDKAGAHASHFISAHVIYIALGLLGVVALVVGVTILAHH